MKKLFILMLVAGMPVLWSSCKHQPIVPDQLEPTDLTQHDLKVLAQGNQFGFKLFELMGEEAPDSNLCISPYSIYTALAMAANGAGSQTLHEMLDILDFEDQDIPDLNESVRSINKILLAKDPQTVFETANSVWYNTDGFSVYPDFVTSMNAYYSAPVEGLSFSDPATLPTVNGWVKEKTHEKIDKIIEMIMPDDVCYLINALYFNGKWTTIFDKKATGLLGFRNSAGENRMVPTMYLKDTVWSIVNPDLQAVRLPYGDESWAMYLFLPSPTTDLNDWSADNLTEGWADLQSQFEPVAGMELYLPQFKMESSFELSKQLKLMGMPTAFSGAADFSRLGPGPLAISEVLHKTFIDVNEEGTEAAAVTAVIITRTSMPMNEIRFNHPFVFVIAEKTTGSIIFIGKLHNPQ